jgi:cytochrome b6-f complex iron-sulfur subunit
MSDTNDEKRSADSKDSRRAFLWKLWLGLGAVAGLEYVWLAVDFLRPRRRGVGDDSGAIVVAGPLERFDSNSVTAFPQGKFYLARLQNGGFLALSRTCTHLGCTVPWDDEQGQFVCPCHSSAYDITGAVLNPPAPRPLDLYPVRIENGVVKVDVRAPIKRQVFEQSQLTVDG